MHNNKKSLEKRIWRSPESDDEQPKKRKKKEERILTESYYDYEERKRREREEKERERKDRERTVKEVLGYTNEENPFGDTKLTERFVWKKKQQVLKEKGLIQNNKEKNDEDLVKELLKAKESRILREKEKREAEEERERLARERERSTYHEWEKKEEEFHLKQAKLKTDIRLKQGRPKPIDLIAKNLKLLDTENENNQQLEEPILTMDDIDIEMREPYIIFKGLSVKELEELRSDINLHLELDKRMRGFWNALLIVCDDELRKAKIQEEASKSGAENRSGAINPAVMQAIEELFIGKSYSELQELETEIYEKTTNPDPTDDVEYWESLMKELVIFKAKALLREFHLTLLQAHLNKNKDGKQKEGVVENKQTKTEVVSQTTDDVITTEQMVQRVPQRIQQEMTSFEDLIKAEELRTNEYVYRGLTEDEMFRSVQNDIEEGDDEFADEIQLETQYYPWNDKYRPRKPKYFNRVHTGYEWNKYNQVHYDMDNPPPKTIQGYKFNIFYPDLIDKSKPPQYFIEPGKTKDTCIIRFHAGPPYEDIAFKIVNKEWERSHRRGFKCSFERGILHLYFKFKRYRYKR